MAGVLEAGVAAALVLVLGAGAPPGLDREGVGEVRLAAPARGRGVVMVVVEAEGCCRGSL